MALAVLRGAVEFILGDDLPTAVGIVLALAATALLATSSLAAWWLMPLAAIALLRWSLLRRARSLTGHSAVGAQAADGPGAGGAP